MNKRAQRRPSFVGGRVIQQSFDPSVRKNMCSCNTELLEAELKKFRQSSAEAVQNSWNEAEKLQEQCSHYDDQILSLKNDIEWKTAQLQETLNRARDLEDELHELNAEKSQVSSRRGSMRSILSSCHSIGSQKSLGEDSAVQSTVAAPQNTNKAQEEKRSDETNPNEIDTKAEIRRLKLILQSRDSTIEAMEFALSQNVRMM